MSDIICIRDLSIPSNDATTLRNVSFSVEDGEFLVLLGPTGNARSSLVRMMTGLEEGMSGSLIIDGIQIVGASEETLSALRRDTISILFPHNNLLPSYTVRKNLVFPSLIAHRAIDETWLERIVSTFGIADYLEALPGDLSHVQCQRIALARAVFNRSKIILADEVTSGLTGTDALQVLDLLRMCTREFNKTIVMTTRDFSVSSIADRVIIITDGIIKGTITAPTPRSVLTAVEAITSTPRQP